MTAADLYVWGYPLVVMHRTRALHCSRTGLGVLDHVVELATPANRTVVAPNNDTLYSSGWFDLRAGDLVVDVPPIDRYWSVMVLDAYTYVAYASRRLHGTGGVSVRLTLDPSTEAPRTAATVLPVGTPTVWILVRVLVDGPDDLDAARTLQRAITVAVPDGHPRHRTERLGPPDKVHEAGAGVFRELDAALAVDPPAAWHPAPPGPVRTGADLADAVVRGERLIAGHGLGGRTQANGWSTRPHGSDFGDDVLARAAGAKYALAGHHPAENRSYVAMSDADGGPLEGSRPLTLRFPPDGAPPCDGFWSITVYGTDMFLVENEIGRYSIGDRTPGLRRDADGGLTLTVGGPRPADASNWLPAPAGAYRMGLRVYEGLPEIVDARWFPPPLRPV